MPTRSKIKKWATWLIKGETPPDDLQFKTMDELNIPYGLTTTKKIAEKNIREAINQARQFQEAIKLKQNAEKLIKQERQDQVKIKSRLDDEFNRTLKEKTKKRNQNRGIDI